MTNPIVLVHGAWHGGWCFEHVIGPLRHEGFDVHAVDLPLNGSAGDITAARASIEQRPGAIVLGHSYGGFVITHATVDLDVGHLVYLAALMPDEQDDLGTRIQASPPATALNDAMVVGDDGRVGINPDLAVNAFYDDCKPEHARAAVARLRSQLLDGFPSLESTPPWQQVPTTYVICQGDRALHPELQREFAKQASSVLEWEGAHSPFLAQPQRVIDLLKALAS